MKTTVYFLSTILFSQLLLNACRNAGPENKTTTAPKQEIKKSPPMKEQPVRDVVPKQTIKKDSKLKIKIPGT